MIKLVLLRHGESTYNKQSRFTGWTDVNLTNEGVKEAKNSGKILKKGGYVFDVAYTSVLRRGVKTTTLCLKEMKLKIPVIKSWRLNERHYGALQGLNKEDMAKKFGAKQVLLWRRSYDIRPPALKKNDKRNPKNFKLYRNLKKSEIPLTECLKDAVKRVLPYWKKTIGPEIKKGKKVLISAHGNSLRALVEILDKVPPKKIVGFNIPYGIPLVYELNNDLKPIRHYFLGNKKEIERRLRIIKGQGKAK
jgi:2,3-bisphosphoglycerate-dependent phosphoglycerate mutase